MKIVIAGGTGFIGQTLAARLVQRGDDVAVISRDPSKVRTGRGIGWDATSAISSADAIVNLAGENIGARWSVERKRRIMDSRVRATSQLVDAMKREPQRTRTFVSASAVGYYGPRGDEVLDESAPNGSGYLAEVTRRWEELAHEADAIARVVIARFGVVLAKDGGALQKLLLPFRLGVGGPVGNGRQWMSWVDRDDVIAFIEWALDHASVRGTYNVTSPQAVTNGDFTRVLGRTVHMPAFLPVPPFALRLVFKDMADETLLSGQRVVPKRAAGEGFEFRYPTLAASLQQALSSAK